MGRCVLWHSILTLHRQEHSIFHAKDLRENNLINIAPRFGSDLDGTIEKHSRHSTAMVRVFRLRPVQRWPEDWMRDVQVMFSQVLKGSR